MKREITELITSKERYKSFITILADKDDLLKLAHSNINLDPTYNKYKQGLLFLAYQEDITLKEAISRLHDNSYRSKLDGIGHPTLSNDLVDRYINYYLTAKLPTKDKKLSELYNICLYIGNNSKYFSYQGIVNLENEIKRIVKVVYDSNPTLYSFADTIEHLKAALPIGGSICKEFININGINPRMITERRIIYYSALLNYPLSTLDKYIGHEYKISDYIAEMSGVVNSSFYSNWDSKREFFKDLLKEISRRTIHYSKDIIEEVMYGSKQ